MHAIRHIAIKQFARVRVCEFICLRAVAALSTSEQISHARPPPTQKTRLSRQALMLKLNDTNEQLAGSRQNTLCISHFADYSNILYMKDIYHRAIPLVLVYMN